MLWYDLLAIMAQSPRGVTRNSLGFASQPRAVWWAMAEALVGFVALQLWRPFYFLNDDNLCGWYPVAVETARRLWTGESPFYMPWLFGGYDFLREPGALCLWNPIWLVLSPLAITPWRTMFADAYAGINLLLCAFAMSHLLVRVRELRRPEMTDGQIAFLAFSYTFALWMVVVTPAWISFLSNQAALPVIFLGLLHPHRAKGIGVVCGGVLLCVMAGHLNSTVFSFIFISIWLVTFALGQRRDPDSPSAREGILRWCAGGALALLLISPLLVLALQGFGGTTRSEGKNILYMSLLAMPAPVFAASYFLGMFAAFFGSFGLLFIPNGLSSAIVLSPASYWIFHSWRARAKINAIERACLLTAALVALCVIRPDWLSTLFLQIPLLRSTRVPFREIFIFTFFVHFFIALRPVSLSPMGVRLSTATGVLCCLISLALFRPPAFTPMPLDRQLILSGEADKYWAKVRKITQGKRAVPIVEGIVGPYSAPGATPEERRKLVRGTRVKDRALTPWSLMNAYNYPALSGIRSQSAYVISGMHGSVLHGVTAESPIGLFFLRDVPKLRKSDPELCFFVLRSTNPVRIEWWDGDKRIPLPVPPLPRVSEDRWDLIPR